jgi:RHS repeat-associated protein
MTNSSGAICYEADFYPFGGERIYTNNCDPDYKFTGKERDGESGLDYFGLRYDSSQYGRFMSPDSMFIGNKLLSSPQDLNLYAYALNNPIHYNDPDGKDWQTAWNDVKTFAGSIYGKLSIGAAIEAKVKVGSGEAKAGIQAKYSWEQSLNGNGTVSNNIGIGAKAGVPGGPQSGLSVEVSQVVARVSGDTGKITGKESPTIETVVGTEVKTIGSSISSENVGLGLEEGPGLLLGAEVGATKSGLSALSDAWTQIKNEISPPTPPPPQPPVCIGYGDEKQCS